VLATGFTNDAVVIAATIPLLQIAALFQLSDGTQAIAAGALRGRGHTRDTLWANLLGHYVVGLPIMLGLGFGASLGAPGLWWGLSVGLTATGLFPSLASSEVRVEASNEGRDTGANTRSRHEWKREVEPEQVARGLRNQHAKPDADVLVQLHRGE
jgi:hypothetical protein